MSMEELIEENKRLKERNALLESIINRRNTQNSSAYNAVRLMIIEKVNREVDIPKELENWQKKDKRARVERQIMRDLKWDLRVRNISDFRSEHIEPAREYINKYMLPEDLKKSRWNRF